MLSFSKMIAPFTTKKKGDDCTFPLTSVVWFRTCRQYSSTKRWHYRRDLCIRELLQEKHIPPSSKFTINHSMEAKRPRPSVQNLHGMIPAPHRSQQSCYCEPETRDSSYHPFERISPKTTRTASAIYDRSISFFLTQWSRRKALLIIVLKESPPYHLINHIIMYFLLMEMISQRTFFE